MVGGNIPTCSGYAGQTTSERALDRRSRPLETSLRSATHNQETATLQAEAQVGALLACLMKVGLLLADALVIVLLSTRYAALASFLGAVMGLPSSSSVGATASIPSPCC